jgi:hypothetical protein
MCVPGAVPGVESHVQMFLQTDHASGVRLSGTIIGIRTSRQVSTVHVLAQVTAREWKSEVQGRIRLDVETSENHIQSCLAEMGGYPQDVARCRVAPLGNVIQFSHFHCRILSSESKFLWAAYISLYAC